MIARGGDGGGELETKKTTARKLLENLLFCMRHIKGITLSYTKYKKTDFAQTLSVALLLANA